MYRGAEIAGRICYLQCLTVHLPEVQVYQRRLAEAGGVETLLTAMHRFVEFPMVQLSVILCLIPLSLGALCGIEHMSTRRHVIACGAGSTQPCTP